MGHPHRTTKYVVVDMENETAAGPFDSKEQAKKYFTRIAKAEGWADVVDLIEATGSPFVNDPDARGTVYSQLGLLLWDLGEPDPRYNS